MNHSSLEAKFNALLFQVSLYLQNRFFFSLPKIFRYFPSLLIVGTFSLLGWTSLIIIQHPYSGLNWSYKSGAVNEIDPKGPAARSFQKDDQILAVDGLPPYEARDLPGRKAGDQVVFTVARNQETLFIALKLVKPDLSRVLINLSIIPVALSFWLIGLLVSVFGPSSKLVNYFLWLSQAFALVLGFGSISSFGPLWSGWMFSFLQWWIGPLIIHTHLLLDSDRYSFRRYPVLSVFYILAFIFNILDLLRLSNQTAGLILTIRYLWLGLTLLISAGLLVIKYKRNVEGKFRRKIRIVSLASLIAFLPFVFFSLIPDTLFDQKILPYEITLLALPVLPLGYSYAILRHKLIRIERYVNRSAAYALVILLISALYGLTYIVLSRQSNGGSQPISLPLFGVILVLILATQPLYRILQRWVDNMLYGGWYDDRVATRQISQVLNQTRGDIDSIALTLCQALQKTMQLEYTGVLLNNGHLISTIPLKSAANGWPAPFPVEEVHDWFKALHLSTGREVGTGNELMEIVSIHDVQNQLFMGFKPQLWLLLNGKNDYQGLLILGMRRGGGELNPGDLEVLEVVIRQAGAALENEFLLQEVRQQVEQNRALNRQIFQVREEERKRIARDLHDSAIQKLVGINYQLAEIRAQMGTSAIFRLSPIMNSLRGILSDLRQICADLRPPALDSIGLIPAIRSRITELRANVPFELELDIDEQLMKLSIPDNTALCIYRFCQEAIMNVQKHAAADSALVSIQLTSDNEVLISVEDDGRGFTPPEELGRLIEKQHFGLIGLKEQVEVVGGKIYIISTPGHGCRLTASLPLCCEVNIE